MSGYRGDQDPSISTEELEKQYLDSIAEEEAIKIIERFQKNIDRQKRDPAFVLNVAGRLAGKLSRAASPKVTSQTDIYDDYV